MKCYQSIFFYSEAVAFEAGLLNPLEMDDDFDEDDEVLEDHLDKRAAELGFR